jgi:uncharacterized radical SAM superfamily Fe-S cluster-containing enzyme
LNTSFCTRCGGLAPTRRETREGKVYLIKDCAKCGTNETYLSSDAERHFIKRNLDPGYDYEGCQVACVECAHHRAPTYAFVDVTNRCNLNCPMCADGVAGHGFAFDPPLEHFEKIFQHLAKYKPLPTIALFGGEPTVREDLPDIVALGRTYGMRTRVLTNGLRLADPEYAKKLVDSRAHLLVSYDGSKSNCYKQLRGSAKVLEKKLQAVENLKKLPRARVSYVTCLAWGLNDKEVPDILRFCHDQRHILHGIYLMPLVQTWKGTEFDYLPDRMTTEDVEQLLADCFPGTNVKFIPLGTASHFKAIAGLFGREALPYYGTHPNCESFYLLISDGEQYRPVDKYMKTSLPRLAEDLLRFEEKLKRREAWAQVSLTGRCLRALGIVRLAGILGTFRTVRRHVALSRAFKGKGIGKLWHILATLFRAPFGNFGATRRKHMTVHDALRVIILPLEDDPIVETERLERCPSVHVYFDPPDGRFHYVPVCSWRMHNKRILKQLADYYNPPAEKPAAEPRPAAK